MKDAYGGSEESYFAKVISYDVLCRPSSEHGLNSSNVQKFIHSKNLHFDLVINEDMFHESWLMFAAKFNAPIVTICTEHLINFSPNWNYNYNVLTFHRHLWVLGLLRQCDGNANTFITCTTHAPSLWR